MIKSRTNFNNKFFYCSYGTTDPYEKEFSKHIDLLDSFFIEYPNETLIWEKKKFEGATHWSTVAPSLVYGLIEMSKSFHKDKY